MGPGGRHSQSWVACAAPLKVARVQCWDEVGPWAKAWGGQWDSRAAPVGGDACCLCSEEAKGQERLHTA